MHNSVVVAKAKDVSARDSGSIEDTHGGHRKLQQARHQSTELRDRGSHVGVVGHPIWQVKTRRKGLRADADTYHDAWATASLNLVEKGQVCIDPVQVPRVVLPCEYHIVKRGIEDVANLLTRVHFINHLFQTERHPPLFLFNI